MNKSPFVSLEEVKSILNLSGTDNDAEINFAIQTATNSVCDILGVRGILEYQVEDEEIKAIGGVLSPKNMPVKSDGIVVKDAHYWVTTGNFHVRPGELRTIRDKEDSGKPKEIFGKFFVSYTAGFDGISNVPNELKMLAAMIVQASLAKSQSQSIIKGKIKSYTMGTKKVEYLGIDAVNSKDGVGFGSNISFDQIVKQYGRSFRKFKGFS